MEFQPEQRRSPKHAKYDAIHRALLTGLLSNVGTKGDAYEYFGTRGTKFAIFPGSGLFTVKPKWVMAGELVETTKLYARTCAGVQPQWIERAAGHLVERTYSEPRWDAARQTAIATEKVTLYGLVLIPARVVPFGPINPKLSREIFIHHGLVLGELRTEGEFFKFNAALVAEVELLEAKIRQRNLLADVATRYAFYDAKLPQGITNSADFEKWRRGVERQHPRFLYMSKEDLLRADAPAITPENYPDKVSESGGGLKLPVNYRYEPGDTMDGLTVTVPLAGLGQLVPERYEWLVPGMLEEKIAAMLKALPGSLRRNFVPVPEWAKAAGAALREVYGEKPQTDTDRHGQGDAGRLKAEQQTGLREALAAFLERETGVVLRAEDFVEKELPEFMRMNFRVVDDAGKIVGMGRELGVLQRKHAKEAAGTLEGIVRGQWNRSGIVRWDFGELPQSVTVQRFGMTIVGYPALVEVGDACGLRLLTSKEAADESHRAGVRRLFWGEHRREIKGLTGKLPDFAKMKLQYLLLGRSKELQEDLLTLVVDRALYGPPTERVPRDLKEYEAAATLALGRLSETVEKVGELVAKILEEHLKLALLMERGHKGAAETDVHDQLVFLLPKHFLVKTEYAWLEQFPRYVAGMRSRLEKLRGGGKQMADRDAAGMEKVRPWWQKYLETRDRHEAVAMRDGELDVLRWMIEEWRVALFAQELGTAMQISERRIEKQWEKVRK